MQVDFLKKRQFVSEEMDNLDLSGEQLQSTLSGLSYINKFLGNSNTVLNSLKPIIRRNANPLTIVDLGCGGGDLLSELSTFCSKHNLEVNLIGIDGNANIISRNRQKYIQHKNLQFLTADVLSLAFELPQCDILISSHFMYHFKDEELIQFLKMASKKVESKIIFSELQRSTLSYRLFQLLSKVLRFPTMIRNDGLKAISRSFRKSELDIILRKADVGENRVEWKWAFRYLVDIDLAKEF